METFSQNTITERSPRVDSQRAASANKMEAKTSHQVYLYYHSIFWNFLNLQFLGIKHAVIMLYVFPDSSLAESDAKWVLWFV